jgi:phosphatidylserine decarboxylase
MKIKLPIAKYAINDIIIVILITVVMGYFLYQVQPVLALFPLIIFLFVLYFFRDPLRKIPDGNNLILSPADGKIIEISEVIEDTFIKEPSIKIVIFLSLFDVHINRTPCAGRVVLLEYRKGQFLVASNPKASKQNERNSIGLLVSNSFKMLVRQIAGIIAQRIVCDIKLNQEVKKGMRIGMIKFGSRTEIYVSKNRIDKINVKLNDRVKGGESILGVIKNEI